MDILAALQKQDVYIETMGEFEKEFAKDPTLAMRRVGGRLVAAQRYHEKLVWLQKEVAWQPPNQAITRMREIVRNAKGIPNGNTRRSEDVMVDALNEYQRDGDGRFYSTLDRALEAYAEAQREAKKASKV